MNRTEIGKIFAWIIVSMILIIGGCVTVEKEPFRDRLTKQEIQQAWKRRPDKIYYNPGKYNADELWIYEYPDSTEDRYYFRDAIVIEKEHVTYGDF